MPLRTVFRAVALTLILAPWPTAQATEEFDVLTQPAVPSPIATKSLVYSIKKFGDRYFATGIQGHILYSDDGGDTWAQAQVPVRSSLLSIYFVTPEQGWAVGHDGVILRSSDGGKTWIKQYDGIQYAKEGLAFYQKMAAEHPENPLFPALVDEMQLAIDQGADKPLFGVIFYDENHGHVAGAYGMILETTDGGKTWEHRLHTVENPDFNHIFDFAPLPEPGRFFLVGEAGLLLLGDANRDVATTAVSTPWEGSFFASVAAADGAIVIGGLRGRMFRTADEGATWVAVEKPPTSSIAAAIRLSDKRLVAVGAAGEVLVSSDDGFTFHLVPLGPAGPLSSVAEGPGDTLLLGGLKGIQKVALPR